MSLKKRVVGASIENNQSEQYCTFVLELVLCGEFIEADTTSAEELVKNYASSAL
jgi:hypothetical protein